MEGTQVADRELQATTEGNNDTRTTVMMIQVDLGSSRAARYVLTEKLQVPWN